MNDYKQIINEIKKISQFTSPVGQSGGGGQYVAPSDKSSEFIKNMQQQILQ